MRRTEDGHENTFTSSPVSSLLELISVQLPSQRPLPNTPRLPPSTSDGEVRGPSRRLHHIRSARLGRPEWYRQSLEGWVDHRDDG